mmetsp:Transcript_72965/g.211222  ORF Transcript_72965/g.211222 Transcript_72965/m.211222 type:complete len:310 (-) Transcript_72965:189-1118(-)
MADLVPRAPAARLAKALVREAARFRHLDVAARPTGCQGLPLRVEGARTLRLCGNQIPVGASAVHRWRCLHDSRRATRQPSCAPLRVRTELANALRLPQLRLQLLRAAPDLLELPGQVVRSNLNYGAVTLHAALLGCLDMRLLLLLHGLQPQSRIRAHLLHAVRVPAIRPEVASSAGHEIDAELRAVQVGRGAQLAPTVRERALLAQAAPPAQEELAELRLIEHMALAGGLGRKSHAEGRRSVLPDLRRWRRRHEGHAGCRQLQCRRGAALGLRVPCLDGVGPTWLAARPRARAGGRGLQCRDRHAGDFL